MLGDETTHRYILPSEGDNPLVVIGVNPSTANETEPDPTVRKVMGFAEQNGFDSFIMLNVYPQRSTDFCGVPQIRNEDLHQKHLLEVKTFLSEYKELHVLVSFGTLITQRSYLLDCFQDIVDMLQHNGRKVHWCQIGALTKDGHPRHPLYARYDWGLQTFDVNRYLEKRKM